MTEKQKKFADEYLIDLNATRAYQAAYPDTKTYVGAGVGGTRLLRNTKVKKYIDERLAQIRSKKIAKVEEILINLTSVMRDETTEEVVAIEGQKDGTSKAIKIRKHVSVRDRLKAAELLGKRYGLFTDKVNVESNQAVVIIDDIPNTE